MKTIMSHFYNEEYLLPFWLNHHKKMFDHGILIDYHSTDKSVEIIKKICPTWDIITSRNEFFESFSIDKEVEDIESSISGWRICLNITEFLIGNFEILNNIEPNTNFFIPECIMVDSIENEFTTLDENKNLVSQRTHGIHPFQYNEILRRESRRSRKLSNYFTNYPLGRHYEGHNTRDFLILWYGYSPFNEDIIKRKLQIQNKMPESDKSRGLGFQHLVSEKNLIDNFKNYQTESIDLSYLINKFKHIDN
jgi:hypothetical protein